jgi:hypothetical protein
MPAKKTAVCGAILLCLALGLMLIPQRAASHMPNAAMAQAAGEEPVPAFHSTIPEGPLPTTMSPTLFTDIVVQNAYTVAARVKKTLYQQPCYCHCDQSQGHGSLLDCFASKPPRRSARASSAATGSRWTSRSIKPPFRRPSKTSKRRKLGVLEVQDHAQYRLAAVLGRSEEPSP